MYRIFSALAMFVLVGCQTVADKPVMPVEELDLSHLERVMDWEEAAHLERRIGLGTPLNRTQRYVGMTRRQAVDLIISEMDQPFLHRTPPWASQVSMNHLIEPMRSGSQPCAVQSVTRNVMNLQSLWAADALENPIPQHEQLLFFWVDHFATGYQLYQSDHGWWEHYDSLRKHGSGNMRELLNAMLRSPALLRYLTNDLNFIQNVNENLGREYLELFTLGVGQYSEQDLKNLARVFAGHGVNAVTQKYQYRPGAGTGQPQKVLGRSVSSLEDAVSLVLEHPAHAPFIAGKFFRHYVSLEPASEQAIAHVAGTYQQSNFEIKALLRATLELPEFWAEQNRYGLVKSPADLLLGAARSTQHLGLGQLDLKNFPINSARLGMEWIEPPNVAGWPGGLNWFDGGQLEKRLAGMKSFFNYKHDSSIPPLSQHTDALEPRFMKDQQAHLDQRRDWLENRHPDQLVADLVMVEWAARDLKTRRRGGIEFVLHGVHLGDRYWDAIRFNHWIRFDRNEREIQIKSNDCWPECLSVYNKDRPNREGQKRFKTGWPFALNRDDGLGRLDSTERLLIRRLAELSHYFDQGLGVLNQGQMRRGVGEDRDAWEDVFDQYRKAVDKETLDNGEPSIRILNTNTRQVQSWCVSEVLNYNPRLVGIPDGWNGTAGVQKVLNQIGLDWDQYLLPGLTDLHLGAQTDHASIVARLASDGYQLK